MTTNDPARRLHDGLGGTLALLLMCLGVACSFSPPLAPFPANDIGATIDVDATPDRLDACEGEACFDRVDPCEGGRVGDTAGCRLECPAPQVPCGRTCHDLASDPDHCGGCGLRCALEGAVAGCVAGECTLAGCRVGFGDCDSAADNGCEVSTESDAMNCGGCGTRCSFSNAAATCAGGRCVVGACHAGYADCNTNPADGCEANIAVGDPNACGACSRRCPTPPVGATAVCNAGVCGLSTLMCPSALRDCNGSAADGCETSVLTDARHCGACGARCSTTGGAARCVDGGCTLACAAGLGDCDGTAANGCETDVRTSTTHCGACGRNCVLANATAGCGSGACAVASCAAGFGDCDRSSGDGCEIDLHADNRHCGACGNACVGGQACIDGACRVTRVTGQRVCAGMCVNVETDNHHCGACGRACAGGTACVGGSCLCPAGQSPCVGVCRALASDNANCGACGRACAAGTVCSAGMCASTCAAPMTACAAECRNLDSDASHCGACGNRCAIPNGVAGCQARTCVLESCRPGFANCDGNAANGCETDTTVESNCGVCGNQCQFANAAARCAVGRCVMGACRGGFRDCNASALDGCEVNVASGDVANCGACGTRCPAPPIGTTAVCAASACGTSGVSCPSDRRDCNGMPADGCEATVLTDLNHCGSCGNRCSTVGGVPGCAGGVCAIACSAGFGDCDGSVANGCETSTSTSAVHCGACNRSCALPNVAVNGCAGGACTVTTCGPNYGDCDGVASNGCEANLQTDGSHCGRCGTACAGGRTCRAGTCQTVCAPGQLDCGGRCVNAATDNANCGACGRACASGQTCSGGVCVISCGALTVCDGTCRDTRIDPNHCGACRAVCVAPVGGTTACVAGGCVAACSAGQLNCAGTCRAVATDSSNCGACGMVCPARANATATCTAGGCGYTCAPRFLSCDGLDANGCEADLRVSGNCGACRVVCPMGQTCGMILGNPGCV